MHQQQTARQSLTAAGRPLAPAPDLAAYRRRKYEQAQQRLQQRFQRGQSIR